MSQAKKHFTNFVQNELSQNQEDEYKILLKILYENFDDIKDTEDLVKKIDGLVEVEDLDTDL